MERKLSASITALTFILSSFVTLPQNVAAKSEPLPAFPGAVGWGAKATGGRGGKVYTVTNTSSASKQGSLAWALKQPGPRIIVFKTGGVIDASYLKIPGNTTIFGQTAPGDGVALRGRKILITGNNVIIRGIRIFGDGGSGGAGLWLQRVRDIIIDHSSIAWIGDEAFSTWQKGDGPKVEAITLSNSAIYEGLSEGPGHKVCVAGDKTKWWEAHAMQITPARKITLYRNAIINTDGRAPKFAGPVWQAEVVNNISMQADKAGAKIEPSNSGNKEETGVVHVHFVSNKFKFYKSINVIDDGKGYVSGSKIYIKDSVKPKYSKPLSKTLKLSSSPLFNSPIPDSAIVDQNAAERIVLESVGPVPRDKYLTRAIDDYKKNKRHFQCPKDLPALKFTAGTYPIDSDNDGIPDSWEKRKGLKSNNPSDATKLSPNGYVWIEEYANSLIKMQNSGSVGQEEKLPPVDLPPPVNLRLSAFGGATDDIH